MASIFVNQFESLESGVAPDLVIDGDRIYAARDLNNVGAYTPGVDVYDLDWNHIVFESVAGNVQSIAVEGPYLWAAIHNAAPNPGGMSIFLYDKNEISVEVESWAIPGTDYVGRGLVVTPDSIILGDKTTDKIRAYDIETRTELWNYSVPVSWDGASTIEGLAQRSGRLVAIDQNGWTFKELDDDGSLVTQNYFYFEGAGVAGVITILGGDFLSGGSSQLWGRYSADDHFVLADMAASMLGDLALYDRFSGSNGVGLSGNAPDTIGSYTWIDGNYTDWNRYVNPGGYASAANASPQGDQTTIIETGLEEWVVEADIDRNSSGVIGIEASNDSGSDRMFTWIDASSNIIIAEIAGGVWRGHYAVNFASAGYSGVLNVRCVKTREAVTVFLNGREITKRTYYSGPTGATAQATRAGFFTNTSDGKIYRFKVRPLKS